MPTNSQSIWETCKQLGSWLEVLQETTGNRKWFQDLKLLKLIRELESIDSLPPIAIVELKRGKIPICSDGQIQTFQERLNEANGLTSISLLVLRELTGELHTAIPIRARFRPSAFKPDGGLREKPANGIEANLARGIADDAGLSETLKHVKGILSRHSCVERFPTKTLTMDTTVVDSKRLSDHAGCNSRVIRDALRDCKRVADGKGRAPHRWKYSDALLTLKKVETGIVGKTVWPESAAELANNKNSNKIPARNSKR